MRYWILMLLLVMPFAASAQVVNVPQQAPVDQSILIRNLDIDGFVLGDKIQFIKLFKPYRNKYLNKADMDAILLQVQIIYEREGYQQLVSIVYHVNKHRLLFSVSMTT